MIDLDRQDIMFLPGVGPQRAKFLGDELQIHTLHDLLYTFPYKHIDRTRLYYIHELTADMPYVQIRGQILSFETEGEGRKRRLIAHFTDGQSMLDLIWFNGIKYIASHYKVRTDYIVFGRPSVFNDKIKIVHPDVEPADELRLNAMGMQPYYTTTEKMKRAGLTSRSMEHFTTTLFKLIDFTIPETLPSYLIESLNLVSLDQALRHVHYPTCAEDLRKAQFRLKFEELFYIQLNIIRYARDRRQKYRGFVFTRVGELFHEFYEKNLPFQLTEAQKRVIREIRQDMGSGRQMNRLLQGDVGSGKTLVALMTMLIALDNGFQACIMAPTEILAEQHYATFQKMLFGLPIGVSLLTGNVKGKRRKDVLQGLEQGCVQILVGTHAVLEDTVVFKSLGMVVVDEQHRFGVAQRARLWGKNVNPPHVLVMTATPIPRTLAMTLYGDLDVSVIDELPPGRKPIQTLHQFENRRESLYRGMRAQLREGRQIYVVYPLIKESEKMDIKNLEDGYEQLCHDLPECKISKVHGKMTSAEKDAEMQAFISGETQILVATTVIEVGVNVPNASVMVIENAERFGLPQLHQMRGRVGRGAEQSYCILVTKYQMSAETRKRIQIMTETNYGFEIAEADLKLRGPGDLEGTQQSGVSFTLRLANLARDGQILQLARETAEKVLDEDPYGAAERNRILWKQLNKLKRSTVNWGAIS
ncbi:MAG: ATP-dependent DNA helicase RecG [Paraprevotella sp.]|nr:ATP-dependent DNA helicase RecG [Paraprevotella sp.]